MGFKKFKRGFRKHTRPSKVFKRIKKPVNVSVKKASKIGSSIGKFSKKTLGGALNMLESPIFIIGMLGVGAVVASKIL